MSISRKALVGAIATATVAGLAFGIAPAQANPAAGTNPVIDLFGSDTTQDVSNGFASVIKNGSGNAVIASYDADPLNTLVTPGETTPNPTVPTANGSGQGKTLLTAAIDGTSVTLGTQSSSGTLGRDEVEVARSSSAGTWTSTGRFAYIPFAVDAVTYATATTSGGVATAVPNGIPLGSTVGQDTDGDGVRDLTLRNIYGYSTGTVTLENASGTAYTVGAEGSGAQIIPFIPQAGSGTRSFWQTAMGGTFSSRAEDKYGASNLDVQEHNGAVLAAVPNALVPFSIAQHIAQTNRATLQTNYGVTVTDRRNGAVLRNVGSATPTDINGNLNASFPINRAVFNIVENAAIDSSITTDVPDVYNPTLVSLFVGSSAQILTADRPGSSTALVINDFGFGTIPAAGFTPLDGQTYVAGTAKRSS